MTDELPKRFTVIIVNFPPFSLIRIPNYVIFKL